MISLDNNASTKVDPEVRAAVAQALSLDGNPSSIHSTGRMARRAVEEARDEVARLVGGRTEEVFFTSGGTEANAMAIFGAAGDAADAAGSRKIVRTGAEHPSVREAFEKLAAQGLGFEERVVNPDASGALDPAAVAAELSGGARLLSAMLANNEYGGLYPVAALAAPARAAGAVFHTDAVQAAGRVPIDVRALGIDLLSLSAHKMHGPKGVGALWVRKGLRLLPHTPGGGQERRQRAGTENVPGIVGFGVAARLARERFAEDAASIARLRDALEGAILAAAPGSRVVGRAIPRLPNTSTILFPEISGEALAIRLDLAGVAVSVGSACSSGTTAPSPAMLSLGLSRDEARSVVRFSLSRFTTGDEIEGAARIVGEAVGAMREMSPTPAMSAS
jgi:cysteine desulfurase